MFYNVHRRFRETCSSPKANAEHEQQQCDREGDVLGADPRIQPTSVQRISMKTVISKLHIQRTLHNNGLYSYHTKRRNNFYQEIMPTNHNFADDWKDKDSLQNTFFFFPWIKLWFTLMISPIQDIHTLGYMKILMW
jgi:hypothetical protein